MTDLISRTPAMDEVTKALRECLQSIADCSQEDPREPDDSDWRFRCLSMIEAAQNTLAAQSAAPVGTTFSPGDPVEVRKVDDAIDEIVIRRGDVHIEQMSADGWFMGINACDGSYWQFWFGAKNRKSAVDFRHCETVPATEGQSCT